MLEAQPEVPRWLLAQRDMSFGGSALNLCLVSAPPYSFFHKIFFMCVGILSACMYVYHVHTVPLEARKSVRSHGTEVTYTCKPPCGYWDPNLNPRDEQQVLLTAKPSLWLQRFIYYLGTSVCTCACECSCRRGQKKAGCWISWSWSYS